MVLIAGSPGQALPRMEHPNCFGIPGFSLGHSPRVVGLHVPLVGCVWGGGQRLEFNRMTVVESALWICSF